MNEEWRPVVGFEGYYEVSNLGRVRRIARLLHPARSLGYSWVYLCRPGVKTPVRIHRLVAAAFIGELSGRLEVNHVNGVKDDNRLENLEIVTRSGNLLHRHRVLGVPGGRGEAVRTAKLRAADILAIRERRANGETVKNLAREFGVRLGAIYNVVHGKTWKHLPGGNPSKERRLTAAEVITIRTRWGNGERQTDLAREVGVSVSTLWRIMHRLTWKHLP